MGTEPPFGNVTDLAAGIRAGLISPVDLAAASIEQADRVEPGLNAFITFDPERAIERARD